LLEPKMRVSRLHIPSIGAPLEAVAAGDPGVAVGGVCVAPQVVSPGRRGGRVGGSHGELRLPGIRRVVPDPDDRTGMPRGSSVESRESELSPLVRAGGRIGPRVQVAEDIWLVRDLFGGLVDSDDANVRVRSVRLRAGGPHKTHAVLRDPGARDAGGEAAARGGAIARTAAE